MSEIIKQLVRSHFRDTFIQQRHTPVILKSSRMLISTKDLSDKAQENVVEAKQKQADDGTLWDAREHTDSLISMSAHWC